MRLGFIGLGNMGTPIARRLLRAGHSISVYNRTRARAEALAGEGAQVADAPAMAAREAEVVFTMLADDAAVTDVVFGQDGLLSALPAGAVHVSLSTISVALSDRLAAAHGERGQGHVAAPVFGRPDAAEAGKLWVLAAGPAAAVERCLPLLSAIGQGVHRLGEQASRANLVKLTGNFLIASMIEALGEAFALGRKAGVAPQDLLAALSPLLSGAPALTGYATRIAEGRYQPAGFRLKLGLKDVRLALEASEAAAVPLPLAGLLRDNLLAAISHGHGDDDWAALALASAERAGL